jgi:uncharacterized protein (TIGR02145 family)
MKLNMIKSIIQLATAILLLASPSLSAQVVVGGTVPDPSAILDLQSTDKGFLWPRMNTSERNAIISPAKGLIIFNTATLCMEINMGSTSTPQWERIKCRTGIISSLDCAAASVTGSTIAIPVTGGNGGVYDAQSAASTGVTGLTAALSAGNYPDGAGSLSWMVSGVPSSVGTATFSLSAGGYTCSVPFTVVPGTIASLNCAGSTVTGTLTNGQAASGVSASVPYTGGDGGFHSGQTVTSTGVTGLTATLSAGGFASGAGNLSYAITGTPASGGTASFALNIGGQTCTLDITVLVPGSIGSLDCSGATITGSLTSGQAASGVSASVPYTGGDGGFHSGQTVTSTGVTGLTATLIAGNFANGAGNLSYAITGTPASGGTASFALNIGGQTCTLNIFVCSTGCCAKVSATEYKNFMCYNLGAANTSADPFTPGWEINGGYWQWGRSAQAAEGPTATDPKDGAVSGWNTTNAPNGSWTDGSKTANDPCPAGYRVPTKAQWDGVRVNNTRTNVGTFSNSVTNYGAGKKFGDQLMLPAAGIRGNVIGKLDYCGSDGYYWSSTELGNFIAWSLYFNSGSAGTDSKDRSNGLSVRCIAE